MGLSEHVRRPVSAAHRLPVHLAYHYIGCAAVVREGIALPGHVGPLVEALAESVSHLSVVACDPPAVAMTQETLTDYILRSEHGNVSLVSLGPFGSWKTLLTRRKRIAEIVSEASPTWDVVLFRLPNRRVELVWRANRCTRVVSTVGGYEPDFARAVPRSLKKVVQVLNTWRNEFKLRAILRASGVVAVNTPMMQEHYGKTAPQTRFQYWSFRRAAYRYQTADRMQGVTPRFLICCRLTETKGIFEAAEAFARIREELLPNAELHIIGMGEAEERLRQRVKELRIDEAATFHGWISSGPELFSQFEQMDVLLHLSYVEGFPSVIWEALAHSVLVVSTPVGALPDLVADERELLFASRGDVSAVVDAVKRLIDDGDLRRRLLANGYERASHVSLEGMVQDLIDQLVKCWPELKQPIV